MHFQVSHTWAPLYVCDQRICQRVGLYSTSMTNTGRMDKKSANRRTMLRVSPLTTNWMAGLAVSDESVSIMYPIYVMGNTRLLKISQ